ncbi:MAG: hypothetical protein HDQ99_02450 [Lachnospiraceae bacterium]|nr:hypothetical protein [Lachnospiraceae bacterium]
MPVVLNEVKQAEYIIEKGEVGNKPTSTLFLLGKYFRQKENLNKEQTFNKLDKFMQKNYKNYNSALWEDIIEDISKKANKYSLRELNSIGITQSELDKITEEDNLRYQKLLFTMLCYAKLYNSISENNNGWINTDIKEIYRVARVTVKHRNDKFLYLNDLEQMELISFSNKNDNLNIRVNFVDMNGESVLDISDFRELGYEYLNYTGNGKFIKCSECNRIIRKTNNKCLYCVKCKKEKQKEWDLKYKHKVRNQLV